MPIYEYHCDSCGHDFEKLELVNDIKESKCPNCDQVAKRKISVSSYHLSGSGFHNTDYKKQCPRSGTPACCGRDCHLGGKNKKKNK